MLVSIILTTLNCDNFLKESIESCLNQTYSNIELIFVDGGSIDHTFDIIQSYTDSRIRLIHQPQNAGKLPGAINLGVEAARGDYITWMQADSIYALNAIETMLKVLENNPSIGQVYTDFWEIDEKSDNKGIRETRDPERILYRPQRAKEMTCVLGDPGGVCFLIKREVCEAVGPHDIDTYPTHDYDYRLRIAMKFPSIRLKQPLYYWRLHNGSLTGSRPWIIDALNDVRVRQRLNLFTPKEARIATGEILTAYAFDRYQHQDYRPVAGWVIKGVSGSPRNILNRGVWVIFIKSLWNKYK